ncbi:MAG TPA: hypothetical protein VN132_05390, partial [Bdellovibrio sp.]|nr:hypothetical protein [Bdellovibrio sp.]
MFIKNLLKGILLSTAFVVSANATKISPRYPLITEIHGRVWLTNGKSNERVLLKTKAVLMERALLETEDGAQITVALDAQRQFTVLEGSTILLPTISWEGGEAPVIVLKRGNMRWQQLSEEKPSYNVDIRSELFEFQAPKGDFIFTMEPEKAYAGVKVLSGNLDFSALNGEESASVHAGQQVGFQGVIEGKEIAFDVLLKGKKIPKGRLTPVAEISKKDLAEFSGEKQKQ